MSIESSSAQDVPRELLEFLITHSVLYLVGHEEPDADSLAACLALGGYLSRTYGTICRYLDAGPFDRREIEPIAGVFERSLSADQRRADGAPGVVVLDCSGPERVGSLAEQIAGLPAAVIDHHATGKRFGEARFVDPTAPATCYLTLLVIEALGGNPNPEEAELLLFGIATDTGFFRHVVQDTGPLFDGVSRLVAAGASPRSVHRRMSGGYTVAARRLLAKLISRAKSVGGGAGLITWETAEDTEKFGKESRDSDTLYQLLFGIEGVRLAALLREESKDSCTGSLRSIDTIDVGVIAEQFGGGGHKRAAGFLANKPLAKVREELRAIFEAHLAGERRD